MKHIHNISQVACALMVMLAPLPVFSAEALVAVAANFAEVGQELKLHFETRHAHTVRLSSGSTGQLYAQIIHGAPFDLFLAGDQARPRRLIEDGHALANSRFTYAIGKLTLWSADAKRGGESARQILSAGAFRVLAIANPNLAPYGAAAAELIVALGLAGTLQGKIVYGQNVGQVFSMVASGNAEFGLVALSQVLSPRVRPAGSRWDVPSVLYSPIRQDGVLLSSGARNPAAVAFLDFLQNDRAQALIAAYGYATE